MAVTRRTDNNELYEDIVLSVAPLNGGAVGINEPNPTLGTLQIENTYVRAIGGAVDNGELKTPNFSNTIGGQENSSTTLAQFYREGSRVYMDGKLDFVQTGTFVTVSDFFMTLPEDFRPLKTERFICSCEDTLTTGITYYTCEIEVRVTGKVYVMKLMNPKVNVDAGLAVPLVIDTPVFATPTGLQSWISLAGINFRVA